MIATIPGIFLHRPKNSFINFEGLRAQTHRPRAPHQKTQTAPAHRLGSEDFVKCRPKKPDQNQTRKRPRIQTEKDPEFRQKKTQNSDRKEGLISLNN